MQWGVGGYKAKEYVLSGGSAKKYESVLGGGGGQKASKLGVRTLWMAPYIKYNFFGIFNEFFTKWPAKSIMNPMAVLKGSVF